MSLTATEDNTEFILVSSPINVLEPRQILTCVFQVAGEPLDQTVFQYGPFVMTNREEIMKTLVDCESDRLLDLI